MATTTGIKVFAGLGLIYPSFTNGVYVLKGTTSFTLSSFQGSSAGNLTAADLNTMIPARSKRSANGYPLPTSLKA